MNSPLIHLAPGEGAATRADFTLQIFYQSHRRIDTVSLPHIVRQPAAKLFVEGGFLGTGASRTASIRLSSALRVMFFMLTNTKKVSPKTVCRHQTHHPNPCRKKVRAGASTRAMAGDAVPANHNRGLAQVWTMPGSHLPDGRWGKHRWRDPAFAFHWR